MYWSKNDQAKSELKMSIEVTSIILPDESNDLCWKTDRAWHITIGISSLESMVNGLDAEIGAIAKQKAKEVTPKKLSKIWSIDIKAAK